MAGPDINVPAVTPRTAPLPPSAAVVAVKALVRDAPEGLKSQEQRVQIEGRVVSSDPAKPELKIATKEGEVVVQSAAALAPGTDVSLELLTQKAQTLATITLLRKQDEAQDELLKIVAPPQTPPPPPPLKVGDKVIALQLAEEPPTPQAPLTLQEAAKIIEQIKPEALREKIPLPPEILIALGKSKDIPATLQKLQQPQQEAVLKALQPFKPAAPAAPQTAPPEITDNNPLNAFRLLPAARPVTERAPSTIEKLFPFIQEFVRSANDKLPVNLRQLIPQAPSTTPQKSFVEITVQKIAPPGTPPPQPQPAQISGQVEALTPKGLPLIKADIGGVTRHLVFRTPAAIELGSTVIFDVKPLSLEQVAAQTALPALNPLRDVSWPALEEALQALAPQNAAAAATLKNMLPSPSPKFTPTALFFLAALRSGSVENWLGGQALQTLKDLGKRELAETLGKDFGKLSAQSKEPLSAEWRMISMPLLHDEQLTQLQFFLRQQQQDQENDKQEGEKRGITRFLLNLHLSRMGEMQLDGLLRQKQFDLILRSADRLPAGMRQELMQAFAAALEQTGMTGGIGFQVKREHWVSVDVPEEKRTVI